MMAGWPAHNSCSTSACRAASNAARSVLQKRHLSAAALMISPHTGHGLLSMAISLTVCPRLRPRSGFWGQLPTLRISAAVRLAPLAHRTLLLEELVMAVDRYVKTVLTI